MSRFSSKQLKALNWYLGEHHKLRLQLSSPPKVYFKNENNKVVSVHIADIIGLFEQSNEEDKRERARVRNRNAV